MGALLLCWSSRWSPTLILLMSSGSKKKEPRYACLSEAKASHSQRMWAEVSSCAPHLLHNGLSDSPIRWRCLLRVLCPVRRPVTALDCVLLKDRNLTLSPSQGPEINSRVYLWVLPRPHHHIQCWLTNQSYRSYGDKLLVPSTGFRNLLDLRNNPEERSSKLLRGWSMF
jgi:hypothetical protein